jgi:XTP/dITP diphosphohydrolase
MPKKVYLITKNWMKVLVAKETMENDGIEIKQLKVDTPEIQSLDVKEIVKFSARWAAEKFKKPVIKSDTSLWIEALNGFPGPFAHYVDKTLGPEGILRLMKKSKNRRAKIITAVAFCKPGRKPIVKISELKGKISKKLEGKYGWFSDFFFIPDGYKKPMGCYPDEGRKKIWPQDCWKKIAKIIKRGKNKIK